jgi:DNA modification methylase
VHVRSGKDKDPKRGLAADGVPLQAIQVQGALKPKDLVGMPWRVAFALQEDGWYLRSDIIWHKPNPTPESVSDRPTKAHEYLFLLAKSGAAVLWRHRDTRAWSEKHREDFRWRHKTTGVELATDPQDPANYRRINLWRGMDYYYDADAIDEPCSPDTHARYARGRGDNHKWADGGPGHQTIATNKPGSLFGPRKLAAPGSGIKNNSSFDAAMAVMPETRNKRTVWRIPTKSFKGAHFATFPPKLIEPCILAGCPVGGVVLDPFGGAGTTGLVCEQLGRESILIELNPEYCELAARRIPPVAAVVVA